MSDVGQGGLLPYDATGVPNLDAILGGGLPRGGLTLIIGPPGSGKTTLALQIAFAAARAGRRALVLTALSESTDKLVAHLRAFDFFDETLFGDQLQVLSLEAVLPQGLAATADEMRALAHQMRVGLVVLDGFRGVRGLATEEQTARTFLYELGTALGVVGTTTLITSEAYPRDAALFPEATTADVLIGLHHDLIGLRQRRMLEVMKARGRVPLSGLHPLLLDSTGLVVYPRLETRVPAAPRPGDDEPTRGERVRFDLPELDRMLAGGLLRVTNTLALGNPGTGKTLLGLHFALAGIRAGEPVLYLSFRETQHELALAAASFEWGERLQAALAPGGGLTLLRQAPVELNPDVVADLLLRALDATGARRLVVDSVAELEAAVIDSGDARRLHNYLTALSEVLHARAVTALFIKETRRLVVPELDGVADQIGIVAHNVLLLQQVSDGGRLRRLLAVLKTRFSAHAVQPYEFEIVAPIGIRVVAPAAGEAEADRESGTPENP